MTISIGIKVNDGLVIASDSALTLSGGAGVSNVYMNGTKIVNLYKGLPIGVAYWGLASLGGHNFAFWLKELRIRLEGKSLAFPSWGVDPQNYSLLDISKLVGTFFQEILQSQLEHQPQGMFPDFGLLIAGFSTGSLVPETYVVQQNNNSIGAPYDPINGGTGCFWHGQPELINRILNGYSANLSQALINLKVDPNDVPAYVHAIASQTQVPLIQADMPIQDAIDLASFLAEATVKFTTFAPGANVVDGPIDIATITRHEGFKWVRRKLYYPLELNGGHHE
jgi:hypothetical protein